MNRGFRKESWILMVVMFKSRVVSGNKVGKGYGDLMGD